MKNMFQRVLTAICMITLLLSTILFTFSCGGNVGDVLENPLRRLSAPEGLRINGDNLEWNPVEYASRYLVNIDGMEYYAEETRYPVSNLSDGAHTFKVKAMGDGVVYESSDFSQEFTVTLTAGSVTTSGYYSEFDDLTKNESFLGYGFDVIRSSTFSDKYIILSNPIFNHDELMNQRLLKVDSKITYVDETSSSSIEEFMAEWNVEANVNVSWGKKKVGGSVDVKAAYTGGTEETRSKFFHCISFNNQKFYIVLQSDMDTYRSMLTDGFKKDLYSDMEPSKLFELYGTHFITSAVMGGRINSYYLYTSTENVDFHDVSAAVSVDVRYMAGKTDVNVSGGYNSVAKNMNVDIKNTFEVIGGGDFGMHSDADIATYYADWEKSLDNHASLIGIKDTGSLRAVWELIDPSLDTKIYTWSYEVRDPDTDAVIAIYEGSGSRAAQLEAYFFAYGVSSYNDLMKAASLPEIVTAEGIQGIRVNGNTTNAFGSYDVYSGTVNEIDFSPYPANATNVNKNISIATNCPYARINSNKQLVIDYEAPNDETIDIILSVGTVTETIKVRIIKTNVVEFETNWPEYEIKPILNVKYGSQIEEPNMGERPGKIFAGWYTTENFDEGTQYKFGNSAVVSHLKLYAKWEEYYPTISFKQTVINGVIVSDKTVKYGEAIPTPSTPTCDDYTFIGWYKDENCTELFNFNDPIYKDTVIYVHWGKNPKISFASNLSDWSNVPYYVEYNAVLNIPTEPTVNGYTFIGWYTSNDYTTKFDFSSRITTDVTLYAKWQINNYTVKFESNGGSAVTSQSITFGEKLSKPTEPSKSGYQFMGWYKDPNFNAIYDFSTDVISANTTLYAKWGRGSIDIVFDVQGGNSIDIIRLEQGQSLGSLLPEPKRDGYKFGGWFTDTSYTKKIYSNTTFIESTTLYAQWTIISYSIAYNSNGGTGYMALSNCTYNISLALRENAFTRTGYTFIGWNTDSNADVAIYENKMEVSNLSTKHEDIVTLYAIWKANDYVLTLNANGGKLDPETITVTYDSFYGLLPTPTRTGYSFDGWFTDITGGTKITEQNKVLIASDHTIYAHWSANGYIVNYDVNKGNGSVSPTKHTYDSPSSLTSTKVTRTGYTFVGWNTKADGSGTSYTSGQSIKTLAPEGTVTLYAQWTVNTHNIIFDSNGGSAVSTQSYDYGKKTSAPTAPTRAGYAFVRWEFDYPGFAFGNTMPDSPIMAIAVWTKTTSSVEFSVDNGKRDKKVTDSDGVYDTVNTGLDVATLRALGYTKISVSLTFDIKEDNDGYQDLWVYNQVDGKQLWKKVDMDTTKNWQRREVNFTINLSDIPNGTFVLEWGAHGNFDDDYWVGWTHLSMSASK